MTKPQEVTTKRIDLDHADAILLINSWYLWSVFGNDLKFKKSKSFCSIKFDHKTKKHMRLRRAETMVTTNVLY